MHSIRITLLNYFNLFLVMLKYKTLKFSIPAVVFCIQLFCLRACTLLACAKINKHFGDYGLCNLHILEIFSYKIRLLSD